MCLTDIISITFPFQVYPFPVVGGTLGFGPPLGPMLSRTISAKYPPTLTDAPTRFVEQRWGEGIATTLSSVALAHGRCVPHLCFANV